MGLWQFSYKVMFTGRKIGIGMGKTRKDAQQQAAVNPLRSLADKYAAYVISRSETINKEPDNLSSDMENGLFWDSDSDESLVKDVDNSSEVPELRHSNLTGQQKRGESARLPEFTSKRSKEEPLQNSLDSSSSWQQPKKRNRFV